MNAGRYFSLESIQGSEHAAIASGHDHPGNRRCSPSRIQRQAITPPKKQGAKRNIATFSPICGCRNRQCDHCSPGDSKQFEGTIAKDQKQRRQREIHLQLERKRPQGRDGRAGPQADPSQRGTGSGSGLARSALATSARRNSRQRERRQCLEDRCGTRDGEKMEQLVFPAGGLIVRVTTSVPRMCARRISARRVGPDARAESTLRQVRTGGRSSG